MTNQLKAVIFNILNYYSQLDDDRFHNFFDKGDLGSIFLTIHKANVIQAYKDIFLHLPDDMKYEAFFDVYTCSENNFEKLTVNILESLKKLRPKNIIAELNELADDKGLLTIYRGECTKSTHIKKALSWTLDEERALWFAKRFLILNPFDVGYLYEARVNINNVIGYTQAREESEVIVRYKYLELISKTEIRI